MISLDQVLLLEQKVESAVAKIAQLQAENDALRKRCSELTNAFDSKSEQLSTFQLNQDKIETGIKKALDRLTSIENSVLDVVSQSNPQPVNHNTVQNIPVQNVQNPSTQINNQVQFSNVTQNTNNQTNTVNQNNNQINTAPIIQNSPINSTQFYDMNPVQKESEKDPVVENKTIPENQVTQVTDTVIPSSEPSFTEESSDNPEDQGQFDIF